MLCCFPFLYFIAGIAVLNNMQSSIRVFECALNAYLKYKPIYKKIIKYAIVKSTTYLYSKFYLFVGLNLFHTRNHEISLY